MVRLGVVAVLLATTAAGQGGSDGPDTFLGQGTAASVFDSEVPCPEAEVSLLVQRVGDMFAAVISFYPLCPSIPYFVAFPAQQSGTMFTLEGDWDSGFVGTGLGSRLFLSPYNGGHVVLSGCLFCAGSSGELFFEGHVNETL